MSNQSNTRDTAPDQVTPDGFQTPIDPASRKTVDQMSTDGRSTARSDGQPGSGIIPEHEASTEE